MSFMRGLARPPRQRSSMFGARFRGHPAGLSRRWHRRLAEAAFAYLPKIQPIFGQWITREHPKIDRIACPWLIRRFILRTRRRRQRARRRLSEIPNW